MAGRGMDSTVGFDSAQTIIGGTASGAHASEVFARCTQYPTSMLNSLFGVSFKTMTLENKDPSWSTQHHLILAMNTVGPLILFIFFVLFFGASVIRHLYVAYIRHIRKRNNDSDSDDEPVPPGKIKTST